MLFKLITYLILTVFLQSFLTSIYCMEVSEYHPSKMEEEEAKELEGFAQYPKGYNPKKREAEYAKESGPKRQKKDYSAIILNYLNAINHYEKNNDLRLATELKNNLKDIISQRNDQIIFNSLVLLFSEPISDENSFNDTIAKLLILLEQGTNPNPPQNPNDPYYNVSYYLDSELLPITKVIPENQLLELLRIIRSYYPIIYKDNTQDYFQGIRNYSDFVNKFESVYAIEHWTLQHLK